jgi:WD40 repeat protein
VREGIPPIQPQEPISVDNAYRIQELARWGYGAINKVEHSKDGQYMFVQTSIGVYTYHAGTLDEIWRYEVDVGASAFDVGSQYLALGTYSGDIILLDATDGSEVYAWEAHADEVLDIDFSMDETLMVSGADDYFMRVWQIKPGPFASLKFEKEFEIKFAEPVDDVFLVGDTELVYYRYEVIDTNSGEIVHKLPEDFFLYISAEHNIYVDDDEIRRLSDNSLLTKLAFDDLETDYRPFGAHALSKTGDLLAIGGPIWELDVSDVSIWSVKSGELIAEFYLEPVYTYSRGSHLAKPAPISGGDSTLILRSLSFSQDEKYLAATNGVDNVYVLDLERESVKLITEFGLTQNKFSPDGKRIISSSTDEIAVLSATSGNRLDFISEGWHREMTNLFLYFGKDLHFSPDNSLLASGSRLWVLEDGQRMGLPWGEKVVGFSENGQHVYTIQKQWSLQDRHSDDLSLYKQVQLERPGENYEFHWENYDLFWQGLRYWRISPDGSNIRAGGESTPYLIWEANTGKFKKFLQGNFTRHQSEFSSDGRYLAERDGDVIVSEQQQDGGYEEIFRISGDIFGGLKDFVLSPMNRLFIIAKKTIVIYEAATGDRVDSIHFDSEHYGINFAVSPDESLLAVTIYNKIGIWDIDEKKLLLNFDAHLLDILDLAFSPDGRYLATTSWDGTVRLWGVVP